MMMIMTMTTTMLTERALTPTPELAAQLPWNCTVGNPTKLRGLNSGREYNNTPITTNDPLDYNPRRETRLDMAMANSLKDAPSMVGSVFPVTH